MFRFLHIHLLKKGRAAAIKMKYAATATSVTHLFGPWGRCLKPSPSILKGDAKVRTFSDTSPHFFSETEKSRPETPNLLPETTSYLYDRYAVGDMEGCRAPEVDYWSLAKTAISRGVPSAKRIANGRTLAPFSISKGAAHPSTQYT